MASAKRKRGTAEDGNSTPRRRRVIDDKDYENDELDHTPSKQETPTKRQNVSRSLADDLRRAQVKDATDGDGKEQETPRSQRRVAFDTPKKPHEDDEETLNRTPGILKSADRSARRKSARRLLVRQLNGDESDEHLEEEDELARQIYDEEEGNELGDEEEQTEIPEPSSVPETPTKRGRGRPKGSKNKAKNTPPPENLPPHEMYFYQNRPGGNKTSNNTLASHQILNHDEYFAQMSKYEDPHQEDIQFLHDLHARSFDQWIYELENDFNICLFGFGSKRQLAIDFATHLYHHRVATTPSSSSKNSPRIIVINGYNPTLTPKDILLTILSSLLPSTVKLPSTPPLLHSLLETTLATNPPSKPITLIINSIDSPSLRRAASQTLLTTLAANPHIHVLATADMPTFPLLWDLSARSQLRFLFHDCTTFASFAGAELDAVDVFADVLGRSARRLAGRDGVGYVLRSLPENARGLFRILVAEQIAAAVAVEDDGVGGATGMFGALDNGDDDSDPFQDAGLAPDTPSKRGRESNGAEKNAMDAVAPAVGVEYRVLYHKAVEEFVCSNEMGFRTLLKEFHDHQMVESRKDAGGTERLWVPFRREDLEALLEELVD